MLGNGLLSSVLGIRAEMEGFPTVVIGIVMSMYYVGFLIGSLTVPRWLVTVGHVRVFAGLAAMASASALSFSLFVSPVAWGMLRLVVGASLAGLYVTIESWLNQRATNESRGKLLAVYMLVVTFGLGFGQLLLGVGDPRGFKLLVIVGVFMSLAVVPVAMVRLPTPHEVIPVKVSLPSLVKASPLGVLAVLVAGAAGSSVLALGAVYATQAGMEPSRTGVFIYGTGSIIGPIVVSMVMQQIGSSGYFWALAAFFLPLALFALVRLILRARPSQRRFISLPPRSSTAAALLARPLASEDPPSQTRPVSKEAGRVSP